MNGERALELLKIERECVNRNNQPFGQNCSRECGKCDLLQNTEELIAMYDYVIRKMAPKDKGIELNKAMGILQRECESHAHCIECPLGYEFGSYIMCKLDRPPEFYEPLLKEQKKCTDVMYVNIKINALVFLFAEELKSRLGDAIHPKDFESMKNLIDDVARQMKEQKK